MMQFERNFEAFASRVSYICGDIEPVWRRVGDVAPVWLAVFRGVPEPDHTTCFTFGLSLMPHPDWRLGRPELVVSAQSHSEVWGLGAAFVAHALRGECPFSYGQVVRFGERIDVSRRLDAYFLFAPLAFEMQYARIDLPDYVVNLVQAYPVFPEEVALIDRIGPTPFFEMSGDRLFDVDRAPLVVVG